MNRQYVIENQIIEKYLADKLTPSDQEAFEQFYISDPQTLEELEQARRFMRGFHTLASDLTPSK